MEILRNSTAVRSNVTSHLMHEIMNFMSKRSSLEPTARNSKYLLCGMNLVR